MIKYLVFILSYLSSQIAFAQTTFESLERARARQDQSYVNFEGHKLKTFMWLSDKDLAVETIAPNGTIERKHYDAAQNLMRPLARDVELSEPSIGPPGTPANYQGPGPDARQSPNGHYAVRRSGPNLVLQDLSNAAQSPITTDGSADYVYGGGILLEWAGQVGIEKAGITLPASVLWSPDSRYILTVIADVRDVRTKIYTTAETTQNGAPDFVNYKVRHAMAGDMHVTEAKFALIDVRNKTVITLNMPIPYQKSGDPVRANRVSWSGDSKKVYFTYGDLSERNAYVFRYDLDSGKVKTVWRDEGHFVGHWRDFWPFELIGENQFFVPSEKNGFRHIYKVTDRGERVIEQKISSGPLYVIDVYGVKDDWVYFLAATVDNTSDPYLYGLYRAKLDGSDQQLISPQGTHVVAHPSEGLTYFVLAQEFLDQPNAYMVIDGAGNVLQILAQPTLKSGEPVIERVSGVTRDRNNPIWGSLHKPTDFDPKKRYPVIHHVHGTVGFLWGSVGHREGIETSERQALADLGFIVLAVDGMGSIGRTPAFLQQATVAGHQCGGTVDAVMLLKQLAKKRPYIDLSRVGVYGYSQGGNCASRAIFEFPDDIHVAVSGAGNHDSRFIHPGEIYGYIGGGPIDFPDAYQAQDNATLAHRLQGKILFIQGAIDDDVPLVTTYHVISALIKHNKDYDLAILPNGDHNSAWESPYYRNKVWSYFTKYLKGENPSVFEN